MSITLIPWRGRLVDPHGLITTEWLSFIRELSEAVTAATDALAAGGGTGGGSGGSGGGDVVGPSASVPNAIAVFADASGKLLAGGKSIAEAEASAVVTALAAAIAAILPVNLTSEVIGLLPLANLANASAANRVLGRGSAAGAGVFEELTLAASLALVGTILGVNPAGATGDVQYNNAGVLAGQPIEDFGYWSPLTNGDPVTPELIFDINGDTIAVWTPLP